MAYYNCVLISEDEIKQKYPNLLKDGYTSTDIKTEITSWQEKQRRLEGNSYKYDTIPSENEIYNRIEEKEQEYYNSPAYERGLQDILAKAPRDEQGRLLAPNGKPSNLTERQYAQVRTKAFKRWFGDWEKVARSSKFRESKDIPNSITSATYQGVTVSEALFDADMAPDGGKRIIFLGDKYIGEIPIFETKDKIIMGGSIGAATEIEEEYRGKGYGKKAHLALANIAKSESKILYSNNSNSDAEDALWKSLVRDGIAEVISEKPKVGHWNHTTYRILNNKLPQADDINSGDRNVSKVVDENGEPLVVYSGRKKNEFEFKSRLKGFYATNSKYIADTYAKNYNGATYEIFLNIKNPYKINDSTRIKLLNEEEQYAYRKWQMLWDDKDVEEFLGEHDGGIYNGGSEYLVINSNQIKSATNNRGTFSTEDDNIYQEGERTSLEGFALDKRLDTLLQIQRERGTVSINYIIDLLSNSEYSGIIDLLKTKKDGRTPLLSNVSLKFIEGNQSGLFNKSRAFYDAKEKTIYVNTLAGYKDGKADSVLLHEILHAITVNRIVGNKEFREEFDKIINEYLKHFYNSRYNKNSLDKEVAKHYMEEFIADVWSNPETIENLKKIKSDTKLSLWDKIKQFFIKIFKDSNGTLMSNASDAIYRLLDEPELTWNTENYYEGEQITEDKQIIYTPIGKTQQTYTIRRIGEGQYQIINKDGKEVFKEDSKDRRRIFANLAVKEKRAVVVTHKNKQYVVNNKGQIISVTTGDLMKWDDNNGVKKAILKEANEKFKNFQASFDNQAPLNIPIKKEDITEEPQQTPTYQTPTLEEDTRASVAFPNSIVRRDRVNLIKRLIYKGLSNEYSRQLEELDKRLAEVNQTKDKEESNKETLEILKAKADLTEEKAIEAGIGRVIKEVKEAFNIDNPNNSKQAERYLLRNNKKFNALSKEEQDKVIEQRVNKKHQNYRVILDNWNSLLDEALVLIHNEYGIKIDKSSEPEIEEEVGKDMYQFKARLEDIRSSLSKEVQKLISNVKHIKSDGKILKDDLGFAKYLNSDYVHMSLLNYLSKARNCQDFWRIFEKLAIKKPWVAELQKELEKNESLKSKFYQDFRKEFVPYWIEYDYETNSKTGQRVRKTKRINTIAPMYNTLEMWKDNIEGGITLNNVNIFNEDGSINKDNVEKVIETLETIFKEFRNAHNKSNLEGRDIVLEFIKNNEPKIQVIIESLGLEVDLDSLHETLIEKDSNIESILSNITSILEGIKDGKLEGTNMKGESIQLDFFDTFGGYAKNLTKVLNIVDKNGILKSFREQGNTYQSYSVPSYFGKLIENLKNGTPEEIREYIMNKFGKDRWFYNPKTETWNNSWLQSIYDNPTKFKEIIDRKVVLTSNKKSFNDWDDKQYALSMLSEFGIGESKNTAYYYLPVLADAESAEFIQFERIAGSDDTFKRTIREKLAKVVLQEYDRIQLVKQRKIDGAVSIDNFDRNGLKFNFIPELNTYEINGKLFIDALTESINKKNLESRDTIIDTALSTILEEGLAGFKTALNKSGVLVNTKDNRNVYYGLTNEGMNNELTNFYYNNALAQTQIIQLLTTDLAYYKNLNDFQKRFKEVYVMNRKLNTTSKYGRKFEKTLILVDEKRQAPSYDTIKEILDIGVENKRITEKDRNRILSLYKKINVTDAQAFRSLSSYRAVLDMAGRWTPQLEEAFERMEQAYKARLKGDKVTTFNIDDFYIILQTIKPFMYTVTTKSTGVKNTDDFGQYLLSPMQNKNSEFLLVNLMNTMVSALSNSGKLKAIERFMEDYQVDVVQFESAVKCGAQGKVDLSQFSDTDENGVYNYLKEISGLEEDRIYGNPDYITVIDYEDYGIQTENPEHLRDTKALFGTQLRKLIFEDITTGTTFKIDGKSYTKEELWSLYNQLITVNVFNSYNDVAEEFSTIDGIAKLVSRQVKENPQMYSEELRKACELVDVKDEKTGEIHKEFNIPIHEPIQRNRIESLLLSVIKNSVIKQKIKGASCVQVSCFGVSNDLKIVRTKEGGIKHIECYLPAYSKLFFEPFMKKNENGEAYLDVNELPEDLRKCVGYRIPTEGLYSMQPLYIKGFLPIQNGSMIMLPAEITALTGSDFDIDKVFLMLPEFDSGTFIKKASLKWNFKKYLKNSLKKYTSKEDSYDEDFDNAYDKLEQIVKKDESKDILSTNLEKALYKFYEENKEKYTYPIRKVKYNFNKTLEENIQGKSAQRTTQIVNNALIDIIYGILTSPESAHKILDGGNFELAKCGDRICKIANNVTNLNKLAKLLHLEDNSSNSILAKLESMSSEQLDEILKDVETPLSPLSPVTNLYFHGQNANGGKMIGIYANSSVANAMFQMANVSLKTDVKKGVYPIVFNNEIFDVLGDMYDMNGRLISRNIKNFLAASVDNVKDPVLKGLMQSPTTGNLTCMLILAGVDINSVGLFLNQPLTKELITKLDADSNLNINDAIDLLLKAHGLEGKEISANNKQRYSQLLKEDLFKNIIQHNDEADLIFLTKFKEYYDKAKSYRKIVSVLRNDTKNNSIESSVAGCLKLLNNLNEFFNSSNKHFSVGNLISFVNKNREELQEVLNVVSESSVPFMSTFASFGIGSVMELMGPYTPFLNQSLWNIITDDEFGLSKLYVKDSIPDSFYESILNDYYLFILNQNDFYEHFDSNGNKMNEDESREYFIRKFPNEFRKLKNEIPELKNNQFIKKIIPVLPSKNDKFGKKKRDSFPFTVLKFQNSGSLSRIQEEQYSKDWFSLLTSDNPDIVKLGIDLFKYSTYFGFGFKPFSYMRMASVNIRKSIPKYLELINNQNNFDISSERNSIFIHSYLRNHAYDDNIVPTIIGSNLKPDKEGSIVLSRSNPSHRSIIETKLKTGFTVDENKQYYDTLRPMVKVKSEEGTFLYQISNTIIRQNENVALYPVTPLGYKGKIFEYNFNSYPKSAINKTPEVENIEIEDSLSDATVNIDDGRLDFKDIPEYYDDFIGDSLEDFDSYETPDDEGNKVCYLSI